MNRILSSVFLFVFGSFGLQAVPAVLNYAGQVAVNGQPFDGQGLFKFALINADGNVSYWSNDGTSANGSEPAAHVSIPVNGGLYSLLLGNTAMSGMGAIDPQVFAQHGDAKLRVWFSDGVNGFQQLSPDRPFASVPYAFSAGNAETAGSATIADGSINKSMLGSDVIADLNATIGMNRLSSEVTAKLDQNGSGAHGIVVGSLISVPYGQSAPAGYSLYQEGIPKWNWEEKAPVSVARAAYDGVEVLDGKIYFVGGRNWVSVTNFNDMSRYNSVSNSWETLASISVPRAAVACSVLNGKLYAIGGVGLSSVEIYEPTTNTWSTGPALPSEVNHGTAITVDGRIYLIGGRNSNQDINQVLCLDPSTNQWQTKANMPTARQGMKLLWFENRIWAIGGKDDGNQLNTVESYDPDTDSWRVEASLTSARAWPIAWSTNSQIYTGGGSDSTSILLDSLEAYDSTTNQWSIVGNLPENKYAADAVVLNNTVYVVAGNNGSDFSDKVYAADLSASVDGVYDLYRKDGNASAGTPLVQTEVADGSVTTAMLAPEVQAKLDQNTTIGSGTIIKSMLAQEVLNDLNASTTSNNQPVVGSLIAQAYGQPAPAGYSLYQQGTPKEAQLVWQEKNLLSVAGFVYDGVEVIDGKIYVVGGKSTNQLDRLERYDPASSNWEVLSNLPEPRSHICAAVLDGKLYVIGGHSNSAFLSSVAIYDPSNGQWSSGTALPEVNFAACAVTYDDKIYVFGGKNASSSRHNKVFEYSPQSNAWSQKTSMPINNEGHKAIVWRDRIWVVGGYAGSSVSINSAYSYDPNLDSWRTEAPLNKTRVWHSIWAINDQLYVGGGGFGNAYQTMEMYDSLGSKWDELPVSLPQNSYVSGAAVLGNSLYLLGGSTSTSPTDVSNKVYAADLSASLAGVYDLYRKDGNASAGTPVVQAEVADGSVTAAKLDATILKYLKPEITSQPQAQTVYADSNVSFSVTAEGKYLSYQWKKDGVDLTDETNATLTITDANATLHDGNYSVIVSNDFGSVESDLVEVSVKDRLLDGLVGWWKFDETSGTVAHDSSGNGNDGSLNNGPSWTTGKIRGALSFDGMNDYVLIPATSDLDLVHLNISAWIYTSDYNQDGFIFEKTSNGTVNSQYNLFLEDNHKLYWRTLPNSGGNSHDSSLTTNTLTSWNFVSASYDGVTKKIFLNGNLSKSDSYSGTIVQNPNGISLIGKHPSAYFFNGLIDDVRIYDRALSAVEVQALYNLGH